MTEHKYKNCHATGHGRWKQCEYCGATRHSRYYWLAGYKSKTEPPCTPHELDDEWVKDAEDISNDDVMDIPVIVRKQGPNYQGD